MERINKIMADPLFQESILKTKDLEINREFCRHGLDHLIDVSRIAYILALETEKINSLGLILKVKENDRLKEVIYAAGLLHDIARWKEYIDGSDHAQVGSEMARPILQRADFTKGEIDLIANAILEHRGKEGVRSILGEVIWLADDYSRGCLDCKAKEACYKVEQMPRGKVSIVY